jgi:hypothetical protein
VRRAFDAVFGSMIDARARRVFQETLLDWEHESQRAATLRARFICHARAMLSLVRASIGILAYDLAEIPRSGVWVRVALWLLAMFVLNYQTYSRALPPGTSATDQVTLAALLFPQWLLGGAPVALLLSALWRPREGHRPTPFLGLAVLSFVLAFICASWVVPATNQEFREVSYALNGGRGTLSRGAAELTLPELFAHDSSRSPRAIAVQISGRLALVACCPMMILLASQAQSMRRRYRWVATPVMFSALGFALEGVSRADLMDKTVSIWGFPAAALVAAVAIGWVRELRNRGEPRNPRAWKRGEPRNLGTPEPELRNSGTQNPEPQSGCSSLATSPPVAPALVPLLHQPLRSPP